MAEKALQNNWLLGVRSDAISYFDDLAFIDIDYKNPDWNKHLKRVAKHAPKYATVPDLSDRQVDEADIQRAIMQADQLSNYCQIPLIIPKVTGQLKHIPERFAIGYSVPTSYGGASYPAWELANRRVHLLGGSPHEQLKLYSAISCYATVMSVDGNYAQKIAVERCQYWIPGGRAGGKWPKFTRSAPDSYIDCFSLSCKNIHEAWVKLCH